jgi:cytoskeletal protein CcmA (bactofilin family)
MTDQTGHTIGPGIYIKGEVTGAEDLIVEGCIEGKITLKNHLLIGQSGVVIADVQTDALTVYGELRGNVTATTKVEVNETARLVGDIRAPIIYLADGAKFRGSIDMDVPLPRDF